MRYDIAIIGNDEAAFEMMYVSATANLSTVAVLPESRHSSWMTSQALRRLAGELLADRSPSRSAELKRVGTPRLLRRLLTRALVSETCDQVRMLQSLGVEVILGESQFRTPFDIEVSTGIDFGRRIVRADSVVIGTGVSRTAVYRPLGLLPFHRPESLLEGQSLPTALQIIGGGELGAGLAAVVSLFGVRTTLLTDEEDDSALLEMAESSGVDIQCPGSEVMYPDDISVSQWPAGGQFIPRDSANILDCRRSAGFTSNLNLRAIGVSPDENGQLWCGNNFETWCSGVFGIGSVVGFTTSQQVSAIRQAEQILNRVTHRIPRPHYLRTRIRGAVVA